jgi:predicted translin family RNA/ssDNA-binding protein
MLNNKFFGKLQSDYDARESERRQIISLSNVILHESKRVIFSLHRGDVKKAAESLAEIETNIKQLEKKFGYKRLTDEGSYKAAVEEYVEAKMFFKVLSGEKIDTIKGITLSGEAYLGGICDLVGELVRLATNRAAEGKFDEVEKYKVIGNDIMAELVEFDMTGYLRTKYDQAKGHLRKIEQVAYEVKLRSTL